MSASRIVVYGDDMLQAVVPNSAKPFNFQKKYRLSDEQVCPYFLVLVTHLPLNNCFICQTLKISDHYPVEVELKSVSQKKEGNMGNNQWISH